jgi:hypothetical protein
MLSKLGLVQEKEPPGLVRGIVDPVIDTSVQGLDLTKTGLEKTKDFVHAITKTQAEVQAEKPLTQRIYETIPDSAADAGQKLGSVIDAGAVHIKEVLIENMDQDHKQRWKLGEHADKK